MDIKTSLPLLGATRLREASTQVGENLPTGFAAGEHHDQTVSETERRIVLMPDAGNEVSRYLSQHYLSLLEKY